VEVLNKYIATLNKLGKDFFTVGGCGVESERFLVGVQLQEVVAWLVGVELELFACCVT